MNKLKSTTKYYIEQYIINNMSFEEWRAKNLDKIHEDSIIIGYLFVKQNIKDLQSALLLNLYLIKRSDYYNSEVSIEQLYNDWQLFNKEYNLNKKAYVFVNPPIHIWLNTKDNWCKQEANRLCKRYNMTYNEALSDVYFAIMKCYTRGDVYLGSLAYIQRCINNVVLMRLRDNRHRVNADSGLAISSNIVIGTDENDKTMTLEDILVAPEDVSEESFAYRCTLDLCKTLLSDIFSNREIEQILKLEGKPTLLSRNMYLRLLKWRAKHDIKELGV